MVKENGFIVNYKDDYNRNHVTFAKNFSDVKYIQKRYDTSPVRYEPARFYQEENRSWYESAVWEDAATGSIGTFLD